jgi:hypothetical protein
MVMTLTIITLLAGKFLLMLISTSTTAVMKVAPVRSSYALESTEKRYITLRTYTLVFHVSGFLMVSFINHQRAAIFGHRAMEGNIELATAFCWCIWMASRLRTTLKALTLAQPAWWYRLRANHERATENSEYLGTACWWCNLMAATTLLLPTLSLFRSAACITTTPSTPPTP